EDHATLFTPLTGLIPLAGEPAGERCSGRLRKPPTAGQLAPLQRTLQSPGMLPLTSDGRLLLLTCGLRNVAFGCISVVLALYLGALGYDAVAIGTLFTAMLIGGALLTMLLTALADGVGRRRVLAGGGLVMALASVLFVLTTHPVLLVLVAVIGSISP